MEIELSSDPEQTIPLLNHFKVVIYRELACHQYITHIFLISNNTIYVMRMLNTKPESVPITASSS